MPRPKTNRETEAIRRLIQHRLQHRTLDDAAMLSGAHLDEDALVAFTEGRLSETEAAPVVSHLVTCGFCRRITAQLIRLEVEIGPAKSLNNSATAEEPSRIRRFLAELASRVLPSSEDDAVFAYHAPAEDFQHKDGEGNKEESEESSLTAQPLDQESDDSPEEKQERGIPNDE